MPVSATEDRPSIGTTSTAVSKAAVGIVAGYVGRGPRSVRTLINANVILVLMQVVLMQEVLTRGERALAAADDAPLVRELRRRLHAAMRDDLVAAVEALSSRKVIAFMSDIHVEADALVQVFVLQTALAGSCSNQ